MDRAGFAEPFPLLQLPYHLLVHVLANLRYGSLCRAARSCQVLSRRELVDDAARLALSEGNWRPELMACVPLRVTANRRYIHLMAELECLGSRPLSFCSPRNTVLQLTPRGDLAKCWLGPASVLASRGVPMRAGVHCAEFCVDPEMLLDGRSLAMDLGLAVHDVLYDGNVYPYVPLLRYGIRIVGPDAIAFAAGKSSTMDNCATVRPLRHMQRLRNIQAGDRLRLRADLTRGVLGVYRNGKWCGVVKADVPECAAGYEWFITFASVCSVSIM